MAPVMTLPRGTGGRWGRDRGGMVKEAGRDDDAVGVDGAGHDVADPERAAAEVVERLLQAHRQEREQAVRRVGRGARPPATRRPAAAACRRATGRCWSWPC